MHPTIAAVQPGSSASSEARTSPASSVAAAKIASAAAPSVSRPIESHWFFLVVFHRQTSLQEKILMDLIL